jgi:hypothetical protein
MTMMVTRGRCLPMGPYIIETHLHLIGLKRLQITVLKKSPLAVMGVFGLSLVKLESTGTFYRSMTPHLTLSMIKTLTHMAQLECH